MGRSPCCDNAHINKGSWTKDEDQRLIDYIRDHGVGCWRSLPKAAGLLRCGKSCRLRWLNYLRPGLKRGNFSKEEDAIIIKLHSLLGNKWSVIAQRLPGRTDNEIKNHWNSHIKHELISHGMDPLQTHRRINATDTAVAGAVATTNVENTTNKVHSSICLDFQKTTALSSFTLNNQKGYMKAKDLCYEDTGCSSGTTMETQAPQEIKKMVDDPKDLNLELSIGHPIQTKSSPFSGLLQMFPATAKPVVEKQGLCLCWQLGFQNDQLCLKCQMRTGYYNKNLSS